MSQNIAKILLGALLCTVLFAEDHAGSGGRPVNDVDKAAWDVFQAKCVACHKEQESVFGEDGFPSDEFRKITGERIHDGANPMPPTDFAQPNEDGTTLSKSDMEAIDAWLKKPQATDAKKCYETKGKQISNERGQELLAKNCTPCHGRLENPLSLNPKTAIKKTAKDALKFPHRRFLNADSTIYWGNLGDMNGVEINDRPAGMTSLAQMSSMISNGSMPPSQDLLPGLHFKMTKKERADLMQYLSQLRSRELCPVVQGFPLRSASDRGPTKISKDDYETASDRCASKLGRWIPAKDKLIEFLKKEEAAGTAYRGCFWTSSFSGKAKKTRIAIVVEMAEGKPVYVEKAWDPSVPCQTICAEAPTN